jgi:glyoxylase-like metal-dependent hydrolase (beta-lactamase superfamily II)
MWVSRKEVIYILNLRKNEMKVHHLPGRGYDSNIFLVDGDEPFLVDTGTGSNGEAVLSWIEGLVDKECIGRIILTHRHHDHVGGVATLSRELNARVLIHESDAEPVLNGDANGTLGSMFGEGMEPVEAEMLVEGDTISSGEKEFKVIHKPGHTIGSISLFCEEEGTLISGDTLFVGGVGRWDLPTGDLEDLIGSLKRLLSLEAVDLFPGHGPCGMGDAGRHLRDALRNLGE